MSHVLPKTKANTDRSRVWVYFKQCDDDPNKARCLLCSLELCNRGTTTILWNHVKFKHSIDKNMSNEDKNRTSSIPFNRDNINSSIHHNFPKSIMTSTTKLKIDSTRKNTSGNITNAHNILNSNNNNHHHYQYHNSSNATKNLDFIDYNDLSLTSMKPLPSTSLSKNLISRLNQLSSPVTRKLKFWNKKSFQVNQYDPSFKVIYLGNLGMQLWSKDESCLDKPLNTLWNNYLVNMKTEIVMRLTICNSGLKAITRQHGLTQYWSNRLVFCCSHRNYPRIFSWVYRHEGKKMRQELRCHAVFCPSPEKAAKMVTMLNQRLACALQEFRREKKSRGFTMGPNSNALSNFQQQHQKLPRTIPLRRQILAKGSANFRPPLERSKSAPKLTSILEEDYDEEDDQSQEEFEFAESFGDREEDEDEEQVSEFLVEEVDLGDDDEQDSTQVNESNSLATTVYEKTSTSSDTLYDKKQGLVQIDAIRETPNGLIVAYANHESNNFPVQISELSHISSNSQDAQPQSSRFNSKETSEYSSKKEDKEKSEDEESNSQNEEEIQRSSANVTNTSTSSSFKVHMVADQQQDRMNTLKEKGLPQTSTLAPKAKTNNNTSNMEEPQQPADDIMTQEILLSWSNLVIK